MRISVEDFKKKHPKPSKSKLMAFKSDILALRKDGYTLDQILMFLKMNGLETSNTNLRYFIQKNSISNKNTEPQQTNKEIKADPVINQNNSESELTLLEKHKLRLAQEKSTNTPIASVPQSQIDSKPTPKKSSTGYIPPSWNADFDLDAALGITKENDNE